MTWAIVLAGGTGNRLAEESRRRYGYHRPKQFCDFDGTGTLLDKTLARAARITDLKRTVVVVTRSHRLEANEILRHYPGIRTIEQPCARETTPGVALPVLHVYSRDPDDVAVLLPSDHHVGDEDLFAHALQDAVDRARLAPDRVAILGAEPADACDGYGWVVPVERGAARVERFVEKPPRWAIPDLRARGALVNTFVIAARVRTLAVLIGRYAAGWWRALITSHPDQSRLEAAFDVLPPSNFSVDVLERIADRLDLVAVDPRADWSDVGTPDRLAHALTPRGTVPRQHGPLPPFVEA